MKKITEKRWREFTSKNCTSSYSMVVCFAILTLWEFGVKNEEEATKHIMGLKLGMSGAQAQMAISFALEHDAEAWLDEDMTAIVRRKD